MRGWAFDEKTISPKGFLMAKSIKTYTPAANTFEYTDLPIDHPYRILMIRSQSTDTEPLSVLAQVKLSEDHDKRVPIDMTADEIFQKICEPLGKVTQKVRLNETAADAMALYLAPTFLHGAAVDYDQDVIAANDESVQVSFAHNKVTIPATVNFVPYTMILQGYCPHGFIAVPFGLLNDPDDFYNVRALNHLRLTTKGGAAVGTSPTADIVLQQMRSD